ncbi:MAG: hypothetical protein AAFQ87_22490, partial [Bacteroidota bacterium]
DSRGISGEKPFCEAGLKIKVIVWHGYISLMPRHTPSCGRRALAFIFRPASQNGFSPEIPRLSLGMTKWFIYWLRLNFSK